MKTGPHYSKSGECQPKRGASLQRCTLDPGSVMESVHQSLRHVKAADKGASWGTQSSTSFMYKRWRGYKKSFLMRDSWQGWFAQAKISTPKTVTLVLLCQPLTLFTLKLLDVPGFVVSHRRNMSSKRIFVVTERCIFLGRRGRDAHPQSRLWSVATATRKSC